MHAGGQVGRVHCHALRKGGVPCRAVWMVTMQLWSMSAVSLKRGCPDTPSSRILISTHFMPVALQITRS